MSETTISLDSAAIAPSRFAGRVLLVHANAPWQRNGGGIFLDQVAEYSGWDCTHLAISLEGRPYDRPADFSRPGMQLVSRGGVRGMGPVEAIHPPLARAIEWGIVHPRLLRRRLAAMRDELRGGSFDHVVFFLNSIEIPLIADALLDIVARPYSTMEWDLLEHGMLPELFGRTAIDRASAALVGLRRGALTRGVTSEGMARHYQERWGLDSVILRQVAPIGAQARRAGRDDRFVIALCGNMYCDVEFAALLAALEQRRWRLGSRSVELRWVGAGPSDGVTLPPQVTVTGWVSHERSLELLADADVGYAPLWFDASRRALVETSFPSKLISYLSAGVPVLYHGPRYGSPALFLAEHPAGVVVDTLDPASIGAQLEGLASRPSVLAAAGDAARRALEGEFAGRTLRTRLEHFLPLSPPS